MHFFNERPGADSDNYGNSFFLISSIFNKFTLTPPPPPPSPPHQKKQNKTKTNSTCYLLAISEQEVKKILKELSTEKSTGVDILPPKLVKLAANFLARPLSQSIDNSIKKGCFPKMQRLPQLVL